MTEYAIDIMVENKFIKRIFIWLADVVLKSTQEELEKGLATYFDYDKVRIMFFLPTKDLKTRFD